MSVRDEIASGDWDFIIRADWGKGMDTYAIASSLSHEAGAHVPEAWVANRLPAIRDTMRHQARLVRFQTAEARA